ncbi:MAG: hypothetical protein AAFY73_09260 [Pseudomonadota bacterium]
MADDTEPARLAWERLADELDAEESDVARGRMMSADALTAGGKVFCFYSTKGGAIGLGARLGRDYPFEGLELSEWQHLAPFKTRPPMRDWIVTTHADVDRWPVIALEALRINRLARKTS